MGRRLDDYSTSDLENCQSWDEEVRRPRKVGPFQMAAETLVSVVTLLGEEYEDLVQLGRV